MIRWKQPYMGQWEQLSGVTERKSVSLQHHKILPHWLIDMELKEGGVQRLEAGGNI